MANVETASVWERHAARRTFPLLARTKVCRNLFGPVDHEELNMEMNRKLQEISDRDQSRWNFNFEQNRPLPGLHEWEEITTGSVPAFYQESVRNGKARTVVTNHTKESESTVESEDKNETQNEVPSPTNEVNQENRSATLNARERGLVTPVCRRRKRTGPESLRNNNTHITDFFPKRKRTLDIKQTPQSGTSIPSEVTPRKRIR
ncbi:cyclin dependent kinase inhibitor 1Ca [Trichomycterus rosablanca]|uniref:cyclin dependent kinase inhibitor 1Ca n=1 Tax=Trichomycterus rosablanca TaxID=2290929 RepID=UPI002F3603F1